MKLYFLFFCILSMLFACSGFAEQRTWTNNEGKTIQGELIGKKDDLVAIRNSSGTIYKLPINKLSKEDVEYIKTWVPTNALKQSSFRWHKTEKEAYEEAQTKNLPVIILFTGKPWSTLSAQLDQAITGRPEFGYHVQNIAIGLIVHSEKTPFFADEDWGKTLQKKYRVAGWPTMVITDAKGKEIGKICGLPHPSSIKRYIEMIQDTLEFPTARHNDK